MTGTERMMTAIMRGLAACGCVKVRTHNVSRVHASHIIKGYCRFIRWEETSSAAAKTESLIISPPGAEEQEKDQSSKQKKG